MNTVRKASASGRNQVSATYQLNLLENGIDFVKSGIETYFVKDTPDPRAHKYAILHMFSGVLLLLKERLARIRPSLVFKNESEVGQAGAKTTTYDGTLKRLAENSVIIAATKLNILREIQTLRNAIEHYEVELTLSRTKEVIGELAAFIFTFCEDELQFDVAGRLSSRALPRFFALKEIGDRLYEDATASANADAESDAAYLRGFQHKYATMDPDEILAFVSTAHGLQPTAGKRVECPACYEVTLLLLEVGVCLNPACRATPTLGVCHFCQGVTFNGAYHCDKCNCDSEADDAWEAGVI